MTGKGSTSVLGWIPFYYWPENILGETRTGSGAKPQGGISTRPVFVSEFAEISAMSE
jgi:hypothetical protein